MGQQTRTGGKGFPEAVEWLSDCGRQRPSA